MVWQFWVSLGDSLSLCCPDLFLWLHRYRRDPGPSTAWLSFPTIGWARYICRQSFCSEALTTESISHAAGIGTLVHWAQSQLLPYSPSSKPDSLGLFSDHICRCLCHKAAFLYVLL